MKKFLFTCVFASFTLLASAQFMVGTTFDVNNDNDNDDDGFEMSSLTDNLFFGYQINDNFTVGLSMQDITVSHADHDHDDHAEDHAEETEEEVIAEMQIFARYYAMENLYVSFMAPLSVDDVDGEEQSQMDYASLGLGYTFNVWNNVNIEPSYSMPLKDDANGDREGSFNIGITATF
tara:strand:- start:3 stop:533 length:531 start_codon:yes stop_codon:yes gene_type:complete